MSSSLLIVCLLTLASCTDAARCTEAQQIGVVLATAARLRAGCVLLGVDDMCSGGLRMLRVLSQRGIMTALAHVTRVEGFAKGPWRCRSNRPLIVLLPSGDTGRLLRKIATLPSTPRWLIFMDTGQTSTTLLESVYVPFDCELMLAETSPTINSHVTLNEVYRVSAGSALIASHFATWRPNQTMQSSHAPFGAYSDTDETWRRQTSEGLVGPALDIYERRTNLHGLRVRAATLNSILITMEQDVDGKLVLGGPLGRLWSILEDKMNFTTQVVLAPTSAYGLRDGNGTWNGMVGMVVRGEADVALGDFALNVERGEAVSFLIPMMQFRSHIFIRRPASSAGAGIFSAFSPGLWVAIACSALLAAVCLTLLRSGQRAGASWTRRLGDAVFNATALLCLQGDTAPVPGDTSGRMVLAVVGLTGVVLAAAHSAVLTAVLSVQRTPLPFASVDEFAQDNRYQLGIPRGSQQVYFNENSSSRLVRRMYEKLIAPHVDSMPVDSVAGSRKVCTEETYAWLEADVYLPSEGALRQEGCSLLPVPEAFLTQSIASFVTKGWSLRGIMDHNLRILRDAGVVAHLLETLTSLARHTEPISVQQVELSHVAAVGALVALGLAVSCAALAAELALHLATERRARQRVPVHFRAAARQKNRRY